MIHKRRDGVVTADVGPLTVRIDYVWPYSRGVAVSVRERLRGWWWLPRQRRRTAQMLVALIRQHLGVPDDIVYVVNRRLRNLNKDVITGLEKIARVEEW